jgi:hypothetical protein
MVENAARLNIDMVHPQRYKILIPFLILSLFLISVKGFSQAIGADTSNVSPSLKNAINYFQESAGTQSILYSGVRHEGYTADIQGSAYFMSEEWKRGNVYFDDILFNDVPLRYDEVKDELLTLLPDGKIAISLVGERVDRFTIEGHTFIRLDSNNNSLQGFYDLLRNGKTSVLVKRRKILNENATRDGIIKNLLSEDKYYLKTGDKYFAVRSIGNVLDALSDKRNEIKLLIKNRKLDMKNDPERTLLEIAAHYDKLNTSI